MTHSGGPRQDRHSRGDFPANRPRAAPASLTSPTETPAPGVGPLSGLRVAVTRSVDRAGGLIDALAAAGAEPVMVPLIDFETADPAPLAAALQRLAAGEYRWLVISSITTVRALKQWCSESGTTLAALIPPATSVATIGPTSMAILAAEGIRAELAPEDVQSAAGLVSLWPGFVATGGSSRVLLPQSNLASPTLRDGIAAAGWDPEAVTVYNTVDYPADPEKRLTATLAGRCEAPDFPSPVTALSPAEAAGEVATGAIDAVVLASGSAADRVAATFGPLPESCMVIAIGEPTRVEAQRLGMRVAATAKQPTPDGIVAALMVARTEFSNK